MQNEDGTLEHPPRVHVFHVVQAPHILCRVVGELPGLLLLGEDLLHLPEKLEHRRFPSASFTLPTGNCGLRPKFFTTGKEEAGWAQRTCPPSGCGLSPGAETQKDAQDWLKQTQRLGG